MSFWPLSLSLSDTLPLAPHLGGRRWRDGSTNNRAGKQKERPEQAEGNGGTEEGAVG